MFQHNNTDDKLTHMTGKGNKRKQQCCRNLKSIYGILACGLQFKSRNAGSNLWPLTFVALIAAALFGLQSQARVRAGDLSLARRG